MLQLSPDSPAADAPPSCAANGKCAAMAAGGCLLLTGCGGMQSALDPAGRDAQQLATLFWVMTAGAALIWLVMAILAWFAIKKAPGKVSRGWAMSIVWGGAVVPTVVLAALLTWSLPMIPELLEPAPEGSLRIRVIGHQWWWRVQYLAPGEDPVELANEIRLPVDAPVEFELESRDVIHSFWIPSLGGKMDMVPGRKTRLRLEATRTGDFRGVCAEYCGTSHALMAFPVVVQETGEFDAWLARQRTAAPEPTAPAAVRGKELFLANGCGACHAVRGTSAIGEVGPDLTHVGSRRSVGAGTLNTDVDAFVRWLRETHVVKPDVLMPSFGMLPEADLRAIAAYLDGLE